MVTNIFTRNLKFALMLRMIFNKLLLFKNLHKYLSSNKLVLNKFCLIASGAQEIFQAFFEKVMGA